MTDISIAEVLRFGIEQGASDVLITEGVPPTVRIEGDLRYLRGDKLSSQDTQRMVYEILSEGQIADFEREKELDFSISLQEHRFRVNCYWQLGSVGAAFRIVPSDIPDLDSLGAPAMMRELALRPQGLLLVTGPTGHGKSTTQASMIDIINQEKQVHVVTVEDPVEFLHTNKGSVIDQREVGEDTLSFANALKHALRQDPDVILVGEMRDQETISTAISAAETGHLVIATLHTNDAAQSIDRMIDTFPPHQQSQIRTQISLSLLAVLSQRLLPRKGGGRRVLASELLIKNNAVANLIREGKVQNIYSVMETHAKQGMHTLDKSLKNLYLNGQITRYEAQRRMKNPSHLTEAE